MKLFKLLFLSIIILLSPTLVLGNIIITEIKISGDTPDESYIKIFNQGKDDIDISGFRLRKKTFSGRESSMRVFPRESLIRAKGYFVWANSKGEYHLSIDADVWSTAGISSNNSIAITSPDKIVLDSVAWGEGENQFLLGDTIADNPEKNQIIKRKKTEGEYLNNKNNYLDFYLYPPDIIDIPKNDFTLREEEARDKSFPVSYLIGIALFSSILMVALKKALK